MTHFLTIEVTEIEEVLSSEQWEACFRRKRFVFPDQFRTQLLPMQKTNGPPPDIQHIPPVGIPQGAPLSAVLSNLYMLTLDASLCKVAQACGGVCRCYCDDLLLVVQPGHEGAAEEAVRHELGELKLELNEKKTERRFFTLDAAGLLQCTDEHGKPASLQYLGLEFTGQIIQLRTSSLARHHQRMRRGVRKAVCMAKGRKGQQGGKVFKRALYRKFSHLGELNLVKYAERAYYITGSPAILKTGAGQR